MFSKSFREIRFVSASVVILGWWALATGGCSDELGDDDGGAAGSRGMAGSAGTCRAIPAPEGCSRITARGECVTEGQVCVELPCGVSDVGRRNCRCTEGTWDCESCSFPTDFEACPILIPPTTPLPVCAAGIADRVTCDGGLGERCKSGTEVCICWPDDEDVVAWDCDKAPTFWPAEY